MPSDPSTELDLVREIVRVLDDKKAIDLRVLRVAEQSSITDYLVLATGTSEPHLRALRVELEKVLDARRARIAGMDTGEPGSGWTVVDAYQVMIHLFTHEKRDEYRLENLWKDAEELSVAQVLNRDAGISGPAKAKSKPKPKRKAMAVKSAKRPAASKRTKTARVSKTKRKSAPKKSAPRKAKRSA